MNSPLVAVLIVIVLIVGSTLSIMNKACKSGYHSWCAPMSAAKLLTKDEARNRVARQPFFNSLNQAGFSVLRNRPYVQTGIRTPRKTIRSEYSARTNAQTILVQ
jgi:hypothetical protein